MKKLVVAILAFFYISTSVGATVHLHYCMDKLVSWGFSHNEEKKCGNCGMEKNANLKSNCCKDEQKQVKLDSDQKVATGLPFTETVALLPVYFTELPVTAVPSVAVINPGNHSPPRSSSTALYIRHCVFLV